MKKLLPVIGFLVLLAPLSATIYANFRQQIDSDEMTNMQTAYLLTRGYNQYVDFYSGYSPVFHLLLIPIILKTGPVFSAIIWARVLMLIIFAVRIIATFLFTREVFGKVISLIVLPLILFDIIFNYPSLQIRSDNLMLTLYVLGLLLLTYGLKRSSKKFLFFSGVSLSISFLTNIKITPSVALIFIIFLPYLFKSRKLKSFLHLISGFTIPIIIFITAFFLHGTLYEMLQSVLVNSRLVMESIAYPTVLGFWLEPHELTFNGRNLSWAYDWFLIILSGAGAYHILMQSLNQNLEKKISLLRLLISLSFIAQFISLFGVNSAFIQYYLPVNFFSHLLAAFSLYELYLSSKKFPLLKSGLFAAYFLLFLLLSLSTYQVNMYRTKYSFKKAEADLSLAWKQVPPDTYSFPNVLFRPLAYPLITGAFMYDIPEKIQNTFPPLASALEEKKVPVLLLTDLYLNWLKPDAQNYIRSHYIKVPDSENLWKRIK